MDITGPVPGAEDVEDPVFPETIVKSFDGVSPDDPEKFNVYHIVFGTLPSKPDEVTWSTFPVGEYDTYHATNYSVHKSYLDIITANILNNDGTAATYRINHSDYSIDGLFDYTWHKAEDVEKTYGGHYSHRQYDWDRSGYRGPVYFLAEKPRWKDRNLPTITRDDCKLVRRIDREPAS